MVAAIYGRTLVASHRPIFRQTVSDGSIRFGSARQRTSAAKTSWNDAKKTSPRLSVSGIRKIPRRKFHALRSSRLGNFHQRFSARSQSIFHPSCHDYRRQENERNISTRRGGGVFLCRAFIIAHVPFGWRSSSSGAVGRCALGCRAGGTGVAVVHGQCASAEDGEVSVDFSVS